MFEDRYEGGKSINICHRDRSGQFTLGGGAGAEKDVLVLSIALKLCNKPPMTATNDYSIN